MIKGINHVGVVVNSIEDVLKVFSGMFQFKKTMTVIDAQEEFKSCIISTNAASIELIEPLGSRGSIAKFLERRGGGLHHVSLEVDDIDQEIRSLHKMGVRLVNSEPQSLQNSRVAFVHPQATMGVLIELIEKTRNSQ